jgi:hypothetical protein
MFQWIDYPMWKNTNGNIEIARVKAIENIIMENNNEKSKHMYVHDENLKCYGIDMNAFSIYNKN